jgi:8-oxo-dGTP pyrophosphatase MutT (NUDIX family)
MRDGPPYEILEPLPRERLMPVEPVPAATVILLRDGSVSPEVLMTERHSSSAFLPDMYVFPGGRVEDQDHALADRVTGVTREDAARLVEHVPPNSAQAFFVAAIRETFEEAGILLAQPHGKKGLLRADDVREIAPYRLELQAGTTRFREVVERFDLELAADRLAVHAHWITPVPSPKRYDTVFFTALAPPDQTARHDGVETTDHIWIRPEDALDEMRRGWRRIVFPTAVNLETLCNFRRAEEALEASRRRPVFPVLPTVVERDGKRVVVIPDEAGYATTESLPEKS